MANSDLVRSLLRGIDILHAVAQSERGLRLSEIAEIIGAKRPTTHNLVRTLCERGFIEKNSAALHFLGPGIYELLRLNASNGVIRKSQGVLRDLSRQLPEATITLAELTGDEIQIRLRVDSHREGTIRHPLNQSFPPYCTASGLAYQAFLSDEGFKKISDNHPFEEHGRPLWGDQAKLESFLEKSRKDGVVILPFKRGDDFFAAAPIQNEGFEMKHCLGITQTVSGPKEKARIVKILRQAAAEISTTGWRYATQQA